MIVLSLNEHALLHQAGGIADAGHVKADGLDFETVKIGAPENDPRAGFRGKDAHQHRRATVQADAAALHRGANCLLVGFRRRPGPRSALWR